MGAFKKLITDFLVCIWNEKISFDYASFSDNIIINSPLGKRASLQELLDINDTWSTAFPDMHLSQFHTEDYGNVIISEWVSTATHLGHFKGIDPTQKPIKYNGETTFFFDQGKVVRYSCKLDLLSIFKQLGHYTKPEEYPEQSILEKDKNLLTEKLRELTIPNLTTREIECLPLYLVGFSCKQIAELLHISHRTVETHTQHALAHLDCNTKHQCLEKMLRSRLIPLWQDLSKILLVGYAS